MAKIIMMSGLPASGKSTKAKELLEKYGNFVRLNKDLIRTMLHFDKFTGRHEGLTVDAEKALARYFLSKDIGVIVDDTNLGNKHWESWKTIAQEFNAKIEKVDIAVDPDECILRDRNRSKQVGSHVILGMALQYGLLKKPEKGYVICDLDGTLADIKHRLKFVNCEFIDGPHNPDGTCHKKDWKSFFENIPGDSVRTEVLDQLMKFEEDGYEIILISARPENYREVTEGWLAERVFHGYDGYKVLLMRPRNDGRPDDEVKQDMLNKYFPDKSVIHRVIDDRPRVIRMWQSNGLEVIDVGPGKEF